MRLLRVSSFCVGLAVALLVVGGCSSDSPAPNDGSVKKDAVADARADAPAVDGKVVTDGQPKGEGLLADGKPVGDGVSPTDGVVFDGKPAADLAVAACSARCDCPQGTDCVNKQCVSPFAPVYCCDNPGCPIGQLCLDKTGQAGTCPVVPVCKTACDCTQGFACVNGKCIAGTKPVYCCDKLLCPVGQACETASGQAGTCGTTTTTCKVACDCPKQGQTCLAGKCVQLVTQLYCCDKAGCPANAVCQAASGAYSICGGFGTSCTVHCDCNAGLSCTNGKCMASTKPVYCCSKKLCPKGQTCYDTQNNPGVCP